VLVDLDDDPVVPDHDDVGCVARRHPDRGYPSRRLV
jgi:hypothetical protein